MVNTMGDDPENPDVLMVVECTQPDRFRAAFEEMASQMGMEAEDVNGRPLYRSAPAAEDDPMAPGMGLPIALEMPSVGIGEKHVLLGDDPQVRKALSGPAGVAPIAADPDYRRSVALLPEEAVVAWGFSNVSRAARDAIEAGAMPGPQDMAWLEAFGPSVWYMRSTVDGFVGTLHQLPSAQAVHVEPVTQPGE
jgi:hypothetical protein